jgi:hypothetical protein
MNGSALPRRAAAWLAATPAGQQCASDLAALAATPAGQQCRTDIAALAATRAGRFAAHALRAGKALAFTRDHFPLWLRVLYILGVQVWCILPIDECFLALALAITFAVPRYRRELRRAWSATALEA